MKILNLEKMINFNLLSLELVQYSVSTTCDPVLQKRATAEPGAYAGILKRGFHFS